MSRLSAQGLVVALGGRDVVRGVDLDVEPGAVHSILGPSGSGKTTLLRALAGLAVPAAGRLLLDGVDVTHTPPERRGVVLLHQENALFPHLDVGANVGFGPRLHRDAHADARARDVLRLVGLDGFERRRVDTLSGGERQRVALARALAVQPKVLLLDEPLGALDRPLRSVLRQDLRRILREARVTALVVTHDREEALALADRLVLFDAGRVVDQGDPRRVYERPVSPRAARLLGRPNLLPYRRQGALAAVLDGLGVALGDDAPDAGVLLAPEERLQVRPAGDGARVHVEAIEYVGGSHRILVRAGALRLVAEQPEAEGLSAGAPAVVTWRGGPALAWARDDS